MFAVRARASTIVVFRLSLSVCPSLYYTSPCCLLAVSGSFIVSIQERSLGAPLCLCVKATTRVRYQTNTYEYICQ